MVDDQHTRLVRALLSLEGLSVGDALGEQFRYLGAVRLFGCAVL